MSALPQAAQRLTEAIPLFTRDVLTVEQFDAIVERSLRLLVGSDCQGDLRAARQHVTDTTLAMSAGWADFDAVDRLKHQLDAMRAIATFLGAVHPAPRWGEPH